MENLQAVIDAARASSETTELVSNGRFQRVFVPGFGAQESRVEIVDLEPGQPAPFRKRGEVVVFDAASFNQVLADNADAGNCTIYFDRNPEKPSVVAVLNGHGKAGAGWGDFQCRIEFRRTPQWVKWQSANGKMMSQADFAEFIEENIEDIAEPAGAALLEIVTYLQITRSLAFKSAMQINSGTVQFQNVQSDDAKVSANSIDVPTSFALGVAPIFGLPSYRVPARFRYRLTDGKLTLGYKLQRIEDVMRQIIEDVIAKIERGTNVSVMDGLPPNATIDDV